MRTKRSYLGGVVRSNPLILVSGLLAGVTVLSGAILASNPVSADNDSVVDDVNIVVPTACTMNGTGTNSHNATITPGTSNSAVGETTIKAFCNDSEGFAIYAIGYTGNTDGDNTLTSTTLSPAQTIATGTGTSGNSQWAMKLATVSSPTPTYPITIQNSYDSFHTVPDDYDLVAKRMTGTDVGTNAEGSTLTSTYQVYISTYQPADTYNGKVKYVLVHPNFVDENAYKDAVTVVFDGNGLTFPSGETTNTVKYAKACRPVNGYVGSNYQEVMTSNITTGGIQDGAYSDSESIFQTITLPNADKVKVVVEYGMTADTIDATIVEGVWDGNRKNMPDNFYDIFDEENNISGTKTFAFDGDSVTIYLESWATPESGYDKGVYVRVYPIYNTEQPNTTYEELPSTDCSVYAVSGNYQETNPWRGKWYIEVPYVEESCEDTIEEGTVCTEQILTAKHYIESENDLLNNLADDYDSVKGTTITLFAHSPYYLKYDGNGASNEFGMNYHRIFYRDDGFVPQEFSENDSIFLLAPNYKRIGYGFIGWSTDSNASSHIGTATIYGPSETIAVDQTLLNTADNNHEITLYATWLPSSGNIQNWSGCSSMSIGDTVALTDTRDNDTYAVAKLDDGNCWMIENLRLGGDNPINLTTADTQSAGTLPANTTTWSNSENAQNIKVGGNINQSKDYKDKSYAFGNQYSWATAINSTEIVNSGDVATSICPAGWKLPNIQTYNGLINVIENNYDTNTTNKSAIFRSFPRNYVFSGSVSYGQWDNAYTPMVHRHGAYWTATSSSYEAQSSRTYAYQFKVIFDTAGISNTCDTYNGGCPEKYSGRSIRCLAQ